MKQTRRAHKKRIWIQMVLFRLFLSPLCRKRCMKEPRLREQTYPNPPTNHLQPTFTPYTILHLSAPPPCPSSISKPTNFPYIVHAIFSPSENACVCRCEYHSPLRIFVRCHFISLSFWVFRFFFHSFICFIPSLWVCGIVSGRHSSFHCLCLTVCHIVFYASQLRILAADFMETFYCLNI